MFLCLACSRRCRAESFEVHSFFGTPALWTNKSSHDLDRWLHNKIHMILVSARYTVEDLHSTLPDLATNDPYQLECIQLGAGWAVRYQKNGSSPQREEFDFLVCATGMYGWPPHIPVAAGSDEFLAEGKEILHSCTFTDREKAKGKKVVVVGGGKSAVDTAVAAGKEGKSCTLVCREPHWPVPRYLLNLVPFKWGTYSRFGHSTLETHCDVRPCYWWVHAMCTPLKWLFWRVVELIFRCQFCIPHDQLPKSRNEEEEEAKKREEVKRKGDLYENPLPTVGLKGSNRLYSPLGYQRALRGSG